MLDYAFYMEHAAQSLTGEDYAMLAILGVACAIAVVRHFRK